MSSEACRCKDPCGVHMLALGLRDSLGACKCWLWGSGIPSRLLDARFWGSVTPLRLADAHQLFEKLHEHTPTLFDRRMERLPDSERQGLNSHGLRKISEAAL